MLDWSMPDGAWFWSLWMFVGWLDEPPLPSAGPLIDGVGVALFIIELLLLLDCAKAALAVSRAMAAAYVKVFMVISPLADTRRRAIAPCLSNTSIKPEFRSTKRQNMARFAPQDSRI